MSNDKVNSVISIDRFTVEEKNQLLSKLWELLKKQTYKYNGADSSSIPLEKAQDILESLLYTLEAVIENGATKEEILGSNLSLLIEKGQGILLARKKASNVDWKLMCQDLPPVKNEYFLSTMKNIGGFFKYYEVYYEAHNIPCDIDYWPTCPISEELKGISYIEEYLHRIQIENDFINNFDFNKVEMLYSKYVPDYKDTLFNLCEPVLVNSIGLDMIGRDIHMLNVSCGDRSLIFNMLSDKAADEIKRTINKSVLNICSLFGMTDEYEKDYLMDSAAGLAIRCYEALKHNDLSHVFITFFDE